jgi:uncharacterized membrane protein
MWLVYALMTAGCYVGLDFFVKRASGKIDDFLGTLIINLMAAVPALIMYGWLKMSRQEITFSGEGAGYAILAGLSIGVGSITLIKMFATGTNLSIGSPLVRIVTIVAVVLVGVVFLRETLTVRQWIGLVFSILGIGLLIIK